MKKSDYLDLMERVISCYTEEHIRAYFDRVKREGITEHGFPRLCADIGILVSAGRKQELAPMFTEMMTFACAQAPVNRKPSTGNDFSVKELTFALLAAEDSGRFPRELTDAWRASLSEIDPYKTYNCIAPVPPVRVGNWAAFAAASEQVRNSVGLGQTETFIENELASQMIAFDENGMYRDPNEPMLYDLVARLQLTICLFFGYRGRYAAELEDLLERGSLLSLGMQSVTGEIPYGGRSAQFLFNEAALASLLEYGASRSAERGDLPLARRYKAGAERAALCLKRMVEKEPRHIKNRFPRDSGFGCEGYGYFDKYMTTAASFLYPAILFGDDTIEPDSTPAENCVIKTGDRFHKVLLKNGTVFAEYDLCADPHYDASGLGRVHTVGVPSPLCLSVPFAAQPLYGIGGVNNPGPLSLCPVAPDGTAMCGPEAEWEMTSFDPAIPEARFTVRLNGTRTTESCTLTADGAILRQSGEGIQRRALPVFRSDGKEETAVRLLSPGSLEVRYGDAVCVFDTDGTIMPAGQTAGQIYRNRNGIYERWEAAGEGTLTVRISMRNTHGSDPEK